MIEPNEIIPHYHKWLFRIAYDLLPFRSSEVEDLVQEGRVAMWKALHNFDESKGSLPSLLTRNAKTAMRDKVRRQTWTGAPRARGHRRERPATPVDNLMAMDKRRVPFPASADIAAHREEVRNAVAKLSPSVRDAIFRKFWLDESVPTGLWYRAKPKLAEELSHLRGLV